MLKKSWAKIKGTEHRLTDEEELDLLVYLTKDFSTDPLSNRESYSLKLSRVVAAKCQYIKEYTIHMSSKQRSFYWEENDGWILDLPERISSIVYDSIKNLPLDKLTEKTFTEARSNLTEDPPYSLIEDCDQFEDEGIITIFDKIMPECHYRLSVLLVLLRQPHWLMTYFMITKRKDYLNIGPYLTNNLRKKMPLLNSNDGTNCLEAVNRVFFLSLIITILSRLRRMKIAEIKRRSLS